MSPELEVENIWLRIFKWMSLVLGLVKLLSSADMLMNTALQHTALIINIHEAKLSSFSTKHWAHLFSIISMFVVLVQI